MQGSDAATPLWVPPTWIKHVVFLLMIPAIVLLVAAYVPSRIRSAVGHPMLTALMIWACACWPTATSFGTAVRLAAGLRRLRPVLRGRPVFPGPLGARVGRSRHHW
jgi:hypothetical protein